MKLRYILRGKTVTGGKQTDLAAARGWTGKDREGRLRGEMAGWGGRARVAEKGTDGAHSSNTKEELN